MYWTNPDLFVVQSRLYSPGYAGPGRWIIFNSKNRDALSAIGSDVIPEVIAVLARASKGAGLTDLTDAAPKAQPEQILKLLDRGLLVEDDSAPSNRYETFLSHYHAANFEYPFYDYSDADWQERETKIMAHYASLWPAPSSEIQYSGDFIALDDILLHQFYELPKTRCISRLALSGILKFTFGATGYIKTPHVTCLRRTSPSGGARHPTECIVSLREPVADIVPGDYFYDTKRHGLVPLDLNHPLRISDSTTAPLSFSIRSCVERAMWRYRDLRAFRPILLDAGHIIETLSVLVQQIGLQAAVTPALPLTAPSMDFFRQPELARVHIVWDIDKWQPQIATSPSFLDCSAVTAPEKNDSGFLTNPCGFIKFAEGGIRFHVIWPQLKAVALDVKDIRVLSHCILSNRGDRVITREGILDMVPEATSEKLNHLIETGVLLTAPLAERLYKGAQLWSRYGWYLSLLAHLEIIGAQSNSYRTSSKSKTFALGSAYTFTPSAFLDRRTCRNFVDRSIAYQEVENLIGKRLAVFLKDPSIRIHLAALAVDGLQVGLYQVLESGLLKIGDEVDRNTIRKLMIGQYPAGSGAINIWVTKAFDTAQPWCYELEVITLGRLGQQICLGATEENLAVFMTPAVHDLALLGFLGIEQNQDQFVTYAFAVGYPKLAGASVTALNSP